MPVKSGVFIFGVKLHAGREGLYPMGQTKEVSSCQGLNCMQETVFLGGGTVSLLGRFSWKAVFTVGLSN